MVERLFELFGEANGLVQAILVSIVCVVSGYLQWLVALPALIRRVRRRSG
jgi:hypothetical protein